MAYRSVWCILAPAKIISTCCIPEFPVGIRCNYIACTVKCFKCTLFWWWTALVNRHCTEINRWRAVINRNKTCRHGNCNGKVIIFRARISYFLICIGVSNESKWFEIIFVNDGSKDDTLAFLKKLAGRSEKIKYISFSRNFGKEAAMLSGLEHCKGSCAVIMDADLGHLAPMMPIVTGSLAEVRVCDNDITIRYDYR